MMRVDTRWHLFGYPGSPCSASSRRAIGAVVLLYNIYAQDRRSHKNRPH
jgi:hypothetical protein